MWRLSLSMTGAKEKKAATGNKNKRIKLFFLIAYTIVHFLWHIKLLGWFMCSVVYDVLKSKLKRHQSTSFYPHWAWGMLACSVQMISHLDSQSMFQMFTLFSGCSHNLAGVPWPYTNMATPILGSGNLCQIFRQISEAWVKTQRHKTWRSSILINPLEPHKFWLHLLDGFQIFFYCIRIAWLHVQGKNKTNDSQWCFFFI